MISGVGNVGHTPSKGLGGRDSGGVECWGERVYARAASGENTRDRRRANWQKRRWQQRAPVRHAQGGSRASDSDGDSGSQLEARHSTDGTDCEACLCCVAGVVRAVEQAMMAEGGMEEWLRPRGNKSPPIKPPNSSEKRGTQRVSVPATAVSFGPAPGNIFDRAPGLSISAMVPRLLSQPLVLLRSFIYYIRLLVLYAQHLGLEQTAWVHVTALLSDALDSIISIGQRGV
ncbi:hypothetical protein G7046_g8610 [Stylonectria norvegica]|nr:hypothetical protein G7046_g8610 [Stylonectria norvegica]